MSQATASPPLLEGVVTRAQSGFYAIETDGGEFYTAVMRGRFKKDRRREGLVVLGDRVQLEVLDSPEGDTGNVDAVVVERLPRRTVLVRRAPGPKGAWALNVVVANIDRLIPTFSVQRPEPSFGMLDRFLALAELEGIESHIVFNKIDLGVPVSVAVAIDAYAKIGYRVFRTSTLQGDEVVALGESLNEGISAFVGPSGVGKSSLLNAIEPGLGLRVGSVSEALDKGKHTTRVGELHRLAGGGWVADTPGLREIGLGEIDAESISWAFREFRPYLGSCRFPNCTHVHEPGCAVKSAVDAGEITQHRYESYLRLIEDVDPPR